MRRRSGMVLILVLSVMLIGGGLVYVATDMAGKAHTSSMNMVTGDRLYNAAQSGLEMGKAVLWEHYHAGDLMTEKMSLNGADPSWEDLSAQDSSGNPISTVFPQRDSRIKIEVNILSCNYETPGSYIEKLPPLWSGGKGGGVGSSSISEVGSSGFIDPNRNLLGNGVDGSLAFVIRSRATYNEGGHDERAKEVEIMVVMKDE